MSLVGLIVVLIVFGLLFYLVQLLPLPDPFPTIIRIVVILALILWILNAFGLFAGPVFVHR